MACSKIFAPPPGGREDNSPLEVRNLNPRNPNEFRVVGQLEFLGGCHRSRYSETCAFSGTRDAQVCEYADLWHPKLTHYRIPKSD
jgi:hypothetical protein